MRCGSDSLNFSENYLGIYFTLVFIIFSHMIVNGAPYLHKDFFNLEDGRMDKVY